MKYLLVFFISISMIGCSGSSKPGEELENSKRPTVIKIYSNRMDIVMDDTLKAGWNLRKYS